jgi:hypothetical protein
MITLCEVDGGLEWTPRADLTRLSSRVVLGSSPDESRHARQNTRDGVRPPDEANDKEVA